MTISINMAHFIANAFSNALPAKCELMANNRAAVEG